MGDEGRGFDRRKSAAESEGPSATLRTGSRGTPMVPQIRKYYSVNGRGCGGDAVERGKSLRRNFERCGFEIFAEML